MTRSGASRTTIQLAQWRAFLISVPEGGASCIHVVGLNLGTGCSRVTSPVIHIGKHAPSVVTQSGRVYRLVGECGPSGLCRGVANRLAAPGRGKVMADITGWLFDVPQLGFVDGVPQHPFRL